MKHIFALILLLIFFRSQAQTKILDCSVDWSTHQLTTFLSDSTGIQSMDVNIGTEYGSNDAFQYSSSVPGTIPDNMIVVPITNVTAGDYYVSVTIHRNDSSDATIELQVSE